MFFTIWCYLFSQLVLEVLLVCIQSVWFSVYDRVFAELFDKRLQLRYMTEFRTWHWHDLHWTVTGLFEVTCKKLQVIRYITGFQTWLQQETLMSLCTLLLLLEVTPNQSHSTSTRNQWSFFNDFFYDLRNLKPWASVRK